MKEEIGRRDLAERTFRLVLGGQVLRSGPSIGANVEEGQAAQSRADFLTKYTIACKEAREANYWLRLIAATGTFPEEKLEDLTRESDELIAILTTSAKNLKK